jgi:hypothetical protein
MRVTNRFTTATVRLKPDTTGWFRTAFRLLVAFTLAAILFGVNVAHGGQGEVTATVKMVQGGVIQSTPARDRPVPTGTGAVTGRIVDGATGAAIARARVTLLGGGGPRPSAITDASGVFAFADLPTGPVTLSVEKSTYMPTRFPEPGRTMRSAHRPLMVRDGQVLANITVPIFRGAAITGRVLDMHGDPLDFAQVSVLRLSSSGRPGRTAMRNSTQTNDLGEFRLPRLEAGTYVVQASPRRMGGDEFRSDMPSPQPQPQPQPLPTFYPSANAIDQAQPIVVERGQTVTGIDVIVVEGFPAVIAGTVAGPDGQPVSGSGFVAARPAARDTALPFEGAGAGIRGDGTFRLTLAPGDYVIEARVTPRSGAQPRPESELTASVRMSVAAGTEEHVALVVGPGATASGRVVFEGTTPPPPSPGQVHVPVFSADGNCRMGQAAVAQDWTFRIEGITGTCSAPPMAAFGRWTLKALIHNGENLLNAPLTFEAGRQLRNLQVVFTDRRTGVRFHVADEHGQTTREFVGLVYPIDKGQWPQGLRTFVSAPLDPMTGALPTQNVPGAPVSPVPRRPDVLSGLRPGEYYVVAVDDMALEDSRDLSVLDRLRAGAVRVTVTEGVNTEVALRRLRFANAGSAAGDNR